MTQIVFRLIGVAIALTTASGTSAVFAQCYHAASGFPQMFHGYYPLDIDASDATGVAPGVLVGGPVFADDALALDGIAQYVALPVPISSVDGFSGVTIEAWVKRSLPATEDVIYYEGTFAVASLRLAITTAGRLSLTVRSIIAAPEVGVPTVFTSTLPVPSGRWVHVAATIDLVEKAYILYLNGMPFEAAGADATTMAAFVSAPTDVTIGTEIGAGGVVVDPFFGSVDEVTVFERALSRGEMVGIVDAGRLPPTGKCRGDADLDLVLDPVDNCPVVANPVQLDAEGDGAGDACDVLPFFAGCFAAPERIHVFMDAPGLLT